ncbi:hypothetical protein A2G06_16750 (plasmid) [Geobacter anodireducens]|nr:hypothetical protein A2G06_16750 [Geobacter anodireducens]
MCEENKVVSFRESFRGVDYCVRATSVEEGVEITLPRNGTFEDLVQEVGLGMTREEIGKAAVDEYKKCLLKAVRRLRGRCE